MRIGVPPAAAIDAALAMLPARMDSPAARIMLLAIGWQESAFVHRKQIRGPARGYWQFERDGGAAGVLRHATTYRLAREVCAARGVRDTAAGVYARLAVDDVLAAAFARLLLWTDPRPLPEPGEVHEAWALYLRTWQPGKPHPTRWDGNHARARLAVLGPPAHMGGV